MAWLSAAAIHRELARLGPEYNGSRARLVYLSRLGWLRLCLATSTCIDESLGFACFGLLAKRASPTPRTRHLSQARSSDGEVRVAVAQCGGPVASAGGELLGRRADRREPRRVRYLLMATLSMSPSRRRCPLECRPPAGRPGSLAAQGSIVGSRIRARTWRDGDSRGCDFRRCNCSRCRGVKRGRSDRAAAGTSSQEEENE